MQVAAENMRVSVSRLVADPEFYLYNYAENSDTSEFLIVNEELLEMAPFIDNRIEPYARGQFSVGTAQLSELVSKQPGPRPAKHFIFHHAFVCSTLLARCLARSDAFFSLKEPQILRRLSDIKHRRRSNPQGARTLPRSWARIIETHTQLLAKRYSHGQSIVIKASNVANNLVDDVRTFCPDSRMVYLHGGLEEFLVSILKKPLDAQQRIGPLLDRMASYGDFTDRYPRFGETGSLTLLQQGALLWLVCNDHFLRLARLHPGDWKATLDASEFLKDPAEALQRVCRHFGHGASGSELERMSSADILNVHAKDPRQSYSASRRALEYRQVMQRHGAAVTEAVRWLDPLVSELNIHESLSEHAL